MENTFNNIVETVQKLSLSQKEELKFLLEKYLIEERRNEIFENFGQSVKEHKSGSLKFSGNIKSFKKML